MDFPQLYHLFCFTELYDLEKDNKVERSWLYHAFLMHFLYILGHLGQFEGLAMTVNHQKQLTVPPFAPSAKSSTVEQHSFLDVDSIPLSLKRSDEFPYIEGYKLA